LCMAVGKRVLLGVGYSGHQSPGPKVPDPSLCWATMFLPETPIPTRWFSDDIEILVTLLARMLLGSVSPHLPGLSGAEAPFSCPHLCPHHGTSCAPSPMKDPIPCCLASPTFLLQSQTAKSCGIACFGKSKSCLVFNRAQP